MQLKNKQNLDGTGEWTCQTAHGERMEIASNNSGWSFTREWCLFLSILVLLNYGFQVVAWASHGCENSCVFSFTWFLNYWKYNAHVLFAKQLFQESDPKFFIREPHSQKQKVKLKGSTLTRKNVCLAIGRIALYNLCIGCDYMVVYRIRVLSHNITRMSTSIHIAGGTWRALVGSNLFGCGHMKCFVGNCNGKIEINVSYLELYCCTARSLLCSCRYFLFSSQISMSFLFSTQIYPPWNKQIAPENRCLEDDSCTLLGL